MTDLLTKSRETETQKLLTRIHEAEKSFSDTKYAGFVARAWHLYEDCRFEDSRRVINTLPTRTQLLKELIEKLRGKSVYKTLKRLNEGKSGSESEYLKALFSLGTHVVIECEQGNKEYKMLLPMIYKRIGELLYTAI